jgi:hypothetical protein
MNELLQAAIAPANILPSALLGFVMLYWFTVIIGLLDLDMFHFHISKEIHIDKHIHIDSGEGASTDWFHSALSFFNLGKVPFMVFMSFLVLPFWTTGILTNYYLAFLPTVFHFLLLIPAFVGSLFLAKIFTTPFVKIFAALEKEHESNVTIIGQVCTVMLTATTSEMGQAAVKTGGSPLILNVKTTRNATLKKGETGLVIDYNPDKKYYLVEPYETIN